MYFYIKNLVIVFFFISTITIFSIIPDTHQTAVAVVLMVKDEVDVIIPTLAPLVEGGIDAIFIYDTGSTDGTQEKVRSYFNAQRLEYAYIIEEPFIDFAASRNRALDLAEELFPQVTFFLMLDAEWYTYGTQELINFCKNHQYHKDSNTTGSCYAIRLVTLQDKIDNYTPRLIRREKNARYAGVVHETITHMPSGCLPQTVYFVYDPKETGQEKSKKRCTRDLQLLQKSLEQDPSNMRTFFYLGQTCQFLDEWEQAIYYYHKRAEFNDASQECYLALYRIACAIEHIIYQASCDNKPCRYQWEHALFYHFAAHNMLPHRAEPLIRIANYYLYNKQYALAYLFAHRAVALPYPIKDVLFVEKYAYDFTRYDILGQASLYVGEYEEGKNAVLQALQVNPDAPHLQHNLSVYLPLVPV